MSDPNSRPLTFSQAQGYEPIPGPLALGTISVEARNKLWSLLYEYARRADGGGLIFAWERILLALHINFLGRPSDEFSPWLDDFVAEYKVRFLQTEPFNSVFDILETIMRHGKCPSSFIDDTAAIFEECRLAYFVDKGTLTILPAATPDEGAAISNALQDVRTAGLQGAETHLRESGRLINAGDWAGSVRESIHAVESVARRIAPNARNLSPALNKMGELHPALKNAFSNLYGYTSDEQGVRHALLDEAESPAQQDEAVFMLGACASFVSYTLRKQRQE